MRRIPDAHCRTVIGLCAAMAAVVTVTAACGGDSGAKPASGPSSTAVPTVAPTAPPTVGPTAAPTAVPTAASSLTLTSTAFSENTTIPEEYTCSGADISPPLHWSGAPPGTKAFVLLVDDPDAPSGTFDHWVLYDLPASTTELPAGLPAAETLASGGTQGKNGAGQVGYFGPCPPAGPEHHYQFRLFALDAALNLQPGKSKAEVEAAIQTHVLAQTVLTGLFKR